MMFEIIGEIYGAIIKADRLAKYIYDAILIIKYFCLNKPQFEREKKLGWAMVEINN